MTRISGDMVRRATGEGRRRATRYDLRLKMRYAIVRHGVEPVTRTGESVNVSVTGLLFRADTRVFIRDSVVAVLDWPVAAPNREWLHLVITGDVVRARRGMIAISIASKRLLRSSKIDPRFKLLLGADTGDAATHQQIAVISCRPEGLPDATNLPRLAVLARAELGTMPPDVPERICPRVDAEKAAAPTSAV